MFTALVDPLKHRFLDLADVAFSADQKVGSEFKVPGDTFKRRFLDIAKVVSSGCQEAENARPADLLDHRFLVHAQAAYSAGQ